MAVSLAISEIFSVKEWRDLENQVRGRSRSLKMVPFDRRFATYYWSAIVNIALSLFSSLLFHAGRQQLSCPVLRPPSGPNGRPQDNIPLHKGNNENSLELIPIKEIIYSSILYHFRVF